MDSKKRRLAAGLTVTGVLAGALAWGGVTMASAGTGQPAVVAAATTQAGSQTALAADATGAVRLVRLERAGRLVLRASAAYVGLTPAQLRAQLKAGKSLAAVAAAQGKSVTGLENAIQLALITRIDNSKLSVARKAALITDVKTYLNAFVNASHPYASLRGAARALDKHAAATPTPTASTAAAE